MVGKKLSHYRVLEELGRGGMGIVYKAEDTKLDRTVAIKVLPPAALANEDDRARFYREAKAAAQLHHPNIASIFEIDEAVPRSDGDADESAVAEKHPFIAMEYIDGMTLSEQIKTSPLKISEAVRIVLGIADALKLAHSKDIVHRDIKSANIMLDSEGRAKVLDFGLAKTAHSTMLTRLGSTIGTVAYMSPEQAKGEDVDNRTDLWALGVVLHELIVGRLPFGGDYEQAIVYSILNESNEPLTSVRTGVPMELERIVNKALAKQADLRYQTAADLMADLKAVNLQASTASMPAATSGMVAPTTAVVEAAATGHQSVAARRVDKQVVALTGVALVVVGALGYVLGSTATGGEAPATYVRMNVDIPGVRDPDTPTSSPDGKYWAMSGLDEDGRSSLFFYDTQTGAVEEVPNSENLRASSFSPDGNWLLARTSSLGTGNGGLYRIQVPRGQAISTFRGYMADWLDDRTLVAATGDSLVTFDIASQSVGLIARIDTAAGYKFQFGLGFLEPTITPDAKKALVTAGDFENNQFDILLYDLDSGSYQVVEKRANNGAVLPDGRLVFQKEQGEDFQLTFAAFDLKTGSFAGPSTTLEDPWAINVAYTLGEDNTLFLSPPFVRTTGGSQIGWFDPDTRSFENIEIEAGDYDRIAVAPSADAVAIERSEADAGTNRNIVTLDLATASLNRITYQASYNSSPVFGPVSGRVYYFGGNNATDAGANIYVKNADGSGAEELVVEGGKYPTVSPDEQWLAYVKEAKGGYDIYATNLETGEEIPVDTSIGNQTDPAFSPDGQFILFSSRSDSTLAISEQSLYVRSFPEVDRYYRKLSEDLGTDDPVWSSEGKFIYFKVYGDGVPTFARIAVSLDGGFSTRSRIEDVEMPSGLVGRVTADPASSRLLMNYTPQRAAEETSFDFHIIQNLPVLLKEIAPKYE